MKNRFHLLAALICLFVFLASLPARADGQDERFKKIDLNGDGYIDLAEHEASVKEEFEAMDTNHDGKVTLKEYEVWLRKDMAEDSGLAPSGPTLRSLALCAFRHIRDTPNEPFTLQVYLDFQNRTFKALDSDHDGRLTLEESKRTPPPGTFPVIVCG